ncbi:MAG: hypothetical protein DRR19_05335 [Candidatus Parabeggiatoa sp. nov. 1]|nr:MAG: hypothetical protein DRR19_05335 [Gammaproteobacteria bacterium]
MTDNDNIHFLGIRHHGPGSARSLLKALHQIQPDAILLEGPSEAESLLPLATHEEMRPPVALLIYETDNLSNTVFYPFADFSPEWQAIHYAHKTNIHLSFMDLPQVHQMALRKSHNGSDDNQATEIGAETPDNAEIIAHTDPLNLLAQAVGFSDGERWWEYMVEQRQSGSLDLFTGIQEAMTALREEIGDSEDEFHQQREILREAWMRKTLRATLKAGYERIAVICGAWHVPALAQKTTAKEDNALLKGLPKSKVQTTWVPWSNSRLTYFSGYGAGISSPGWYQHLWECNAETGTRARKVASGWLTKIAHHLRDEGIDASTASVIESVRVAETLAALRDKPLPDLDELNESALSTLCFGDDAPMRVIHEKLIIGECLGEVPNETPMMPLQKDLEKWQKKLRLKPSAVEDDLELDLRKDIGLGRSHLLHRLVLLEIPWGKFKGAGSTKGTFKEVWRIQWQPEFAIKLIEASVWGVTVEQAATQYACHQLKKTNNLAVITPLVDKILLADLPVAIDFAMTRLEAEAAVASDVVQLMDALPSLANVLRYGNVRRFDTTVIAHVVDTLIARICVGLPAACSSLDNDAAADMYQRIVNTDGALNLVQNQEHISAWHQTQQKLLTQERLHGLIAGRSCRLLFRAHIITVTQAAQQMSFALSSANEPTHTGAWVDGFLRGSGSMLLNDEQFWALLDNWVCELNEDIFTELLPLLRRTFATFPAGERRQMGEKVKQKGQTQPTVTLPENSSSTLPFDENVEKSLTLVAKMLGLEYSKP